MGLQMSVGHMHKALTSATSRLKNMREKGEAITERAVRTVEVTGSAFVLGLVQGAQVFKGGELLGVPLELGAGIAMHGLSLLGFAGKNGDHLANFGYGGLASYANIMGRGIGAQRWGGGGVKGSMGGDLADRLAAIADRT